MGGVDAGVAQPVGNGAQIHARFEQIDRGAVAQTVWVNAFGFERRTKRDRAPNASLQNEPCAKTRERSSMLISEQRLRLVRLQAAFVEVPSEQSRGLRPERADAFLAAFAEECDAGRWGEPDIGCLERDDFLHARSGVEHQRQQQVISAPRCAGLVNELQSGAQLVSFEIFDDAVGASLEGDAQDALSLLDVLGVLAAQILKEAVNSGQAHVASGRGVMPSVFEAVEEGGDIGDAQSAQRQLADAAAFAGGKLQQQLQTVAVAADGVDAAGPLMR